MFHRRGKNAITVPSKRTNVATVLLIVPAKPRDFFGLWPPWAQLSRRRAVKKLLPSHHGDGQSTPGVKRDQREGLPLAERTEEAAADNMALLPRAKRRVAQQQRQKSSSCIVVVVKTPD